MQPPASEQPILADILSYAFRGTGKYIFIVCVVLSLMSDLTALAFPLLGLIAGFLIFGYFCAIYFQFIQTTAAGSAEAPHFPEISDIFGDIITPAIQVIGVLLISHVPLIVAVFSMGLDDLRPEVVYAMLGLGVVYFPMAMLAVCVLGSLTAASPHIVIPAIVRSGGLYWLAVGMLCLLYLAAGQVHSHLEGQLLVGTLVNAIVGTYVLMTNARLLGTIYREREEQLDWA